MFISYITVYDTIKSILSQIPKSAQMFRNKNSRVTGMAINAVYGWSHERFNLLGMFNSVKCLINQAFSYI